MRKLIGAVVFATGLLNVNVAVAEEQSITLNVSGMSCASCPYIVKQSLTAVDGVKAVEVSMVERKAEITYDDAKCNIGDLTAATGNAGFPSEPRAQGG
jgi:mercuric ion binding protein